MKLRLALALGMISTAAHAEDLLIRLHGQKAQTLKIWATVYGKATQPAAGAWIPHECEEPNISADGTDAREWVPRHFYQDIPVRETEGQYLLEVPKRPFLNSGPCEPTVDFMMVHAKTARETDPALQAYPIMLDNWLYSTELPSASVVTCTQLATSDVHESLTCAPLNARFAEGATYRVDILLQE